jgi:hypothetical protein
MLQDSLRSGFGRRILWRGGTGSSTFRFKICSAWGRVTGSCGVVVRRGMAVLLQDSQPRRLGQDAVARLGCSGSGGVRTARSGACASRCKARAGRQRGGGRCCVVVRSAPGCFKIRSARGLVGRSCCVELGEAFRFKIRSARGQAAGSCGVVVGSESFRPAIRGQRRRPRRLARRRSRGTPIQPTPPSRDHPLDWPGCAYARSRSTSWSRSWPSA